MAKDRRDLVNPDRIEAPVIIADLHLSKRRYYHAAFFPGEPDAEVAFTLGSLFEAARAKGYKGGTIYTAKYVATFKFVDAERRE